MKRILLIMVCACVALSGIGCFFYFGYRFTWSLDDKGVLTIETGFLSDGAMPEYQFGEPNLKHDENADMSEILYSEFPWFQRRKEITQVILKYGVTSVSPAAFAGCVNLKQVYLPDSLTAIGNYAFNDCYSLEYIAIPRSVTHIGWYAFNQCHSLEEVELKLLRQLILIGDYAFRNCDSLIYISLPRKYYTIHEGAFKNCSSLIEITIPDGVIRIEEYAFYGCDNLKSASVWARTEIEDYAFPEWTEVTVREAE